ncbi:phosphatidate cytidylyltransferase [Tuwongella immobilis]|uniref:Phosphatidate cytidylyltransferase n=1 Tax=Tuwongella immobilis TaxID=692036 RepID=A0A6C2YTP8_9BACT|nr:phosphatidate cytidylyltransferase [Tuwongella immobilis]VIP04856.1 phosphatidate cytidylyltransferase : Phosphatidate cytidylyltransferase OS=Isosphaera pallida (strain ATCC 43644 / DSM 9630 / IS1B) GN=Isop_0968 PE=4 SV=1: CTP_transf_1 [Tuwongella immobilis]VTS07072.1 phosphatidate cytidylyltransferase : Phosphatidate cytidylyltransferase OS=Isosphaera pallida (strain ATCC 43644 / DSM 9630 / IS1B) GN=Isop_0968 PE=4 SV=1: CTP_transf_1 [Tuwongella immobilis]
MLATRLWMGSILALFGVGILVGDQFLTPWRPFLLLTILAIATRGLYELRVLLPVASRPSFPLSIAGLLLLLAGNWLVALQSQGFSWIPSDFSVWKWISLVMLGSLVAFFFWEMARYTEPGHSIQRIAIGFFSMGYLGLTACCLAQLSWLKTPSEAWQIPLSTLGLALAFFVPKAGDIAAYFTGRFLGRHKMAPLLSPKKTWEGAVGGFVGSVAATLGLLQLAPAGQFSLLEGILAGSVLAVISQLGDLAESLIKRDYQVKDASSSVPGFGGILDVIDSILLAAPVVYIWLSQLGG